MIHEGLVIVPDSCKEVLSNGCAADMGVVDDMSIVDSVVESDDVSSHHLMCPAEVTFESVSSMRLIVKGRLKEHILFWREACRPFSLSYLSSRSNNNMAVRNPRI